MLMTDRLVYVDTTAPAAFDYSYTDEVSSFSDDRGRAWRMVVMRPENARYQCERYLSDLHAVYVLEQETVESFAGTFRVSYRQVPWQVWIARQA